jgi:transcriptional regulator with AAA-type ATPase domain
VAFVALPPLRERPEDILLLTQSLLDRFGAQYGHGSLALDERVKERLLAWSGVATYARSNAPSNAP